MIRPLVYFYNSLYLLQLENFDLNRFRKSLSHTLSQPYHRQPLTWTPKLTVVCVTSLLFLGCSLAISIFLISSYITSLPVVLLLSLLGGFFYFYQFPHFLFISTRLIEPIDTLSKNILIQKAQKKLAQFPHLIVIGITGSYGKTTIKEIIATVLSQKYHVLKTPENINTPLGIARLIDKQLNENIDIFVVEMGAYHEGDIAAICALVQPDIGVLTGINEAHIERFGSIENTIRAKFELIDHLKPNGLAVLNIDNQHIAENYSDHLNGKQVLFYSSHNHKRAQLQLSKIHFSPDPVGYFFDIVDGKTKLGSFYTPLLAKYSLGSISAGILVARFLGLTPNELKAGLANVKQIEHRLEVIRNPNGILVIDDSYNGNPDGVKEAIQSLSQFKEHRKIFLTPGLVETGSEKEKIHREIGRQLSPVADLVLLIRNSVTPFIAQGLEESGFPGKSIIWYDAARQAHSDLTNILKSGDVILFQNDWTDNYY